MSGRAEPSICVRHARRRTSACRRRASSTSSARRRSSRSRASTWARAGCSSSSNRQTRAARSRTAPARAMIDAAEADGRLTRRRHGRRGDGRQHRRRACARRLAQGLPHRPRRPRQDVAREDPARPRARRRGDRHPLRRRQGPPRLLPGPGADDHRADARRLLRQPVRQSGEPGGARGDDRARDPRGDGRRSRCGGGRRRLRRHAHRRRALHAPRLAEDQDGARRSGRLGAGAARRDRDHGRGRLLGRRGHRRGFRAAELRPLAGRRRPTRSPTRESFGASRDLLRKEGILAGSSSGTLLAAALRYCREQQAPKRVVSFVCDSGAKYLSKVFNDAFMAQEGWFGRARTGDLRDVVINRYDEGSEIFVVPERDRRLGLRPHARRRRVAAAGDRGRPRRRPRRGERPSRRARRRRRDHG